MSTTERRKSTINDDALITLAGVIRSHYIKYKMFFTSFDSVNYTENYEDTVLAASTTEAKGVLSDDFFVQGQAKETNDMINATSDLHRALGVLHYYVKIRFGENKAILREILLPKKGKKYRNADFLIGYTKDTLVKVEKYKVELVQAGLTDAIIENIENASNVLDNQRREQVEVIHSRSVTTNDRIEKINKLWKELKKLEAAARIVFFNNPEIRDLFELPKSKRKKATETEVAQEETITE